jgi:hypothetical protein
MLQPSAIPSRWCDISFLNGTHYLFPAAFASSSVLFDLPGLVGKIVVPHSFAEPC